MENFDSIVRWGALRWLHQLQLDPTAASYGIADREYWAWKTKDFPNGTWQGGLAGFLDASELLELGPESLKKTIRAAVQGTARIQRSNGSYEEAYPLESSFAVTGLVLFDLLYSRLCYPSLFEADTDALLKRLSLAAANFLDRTPETHGTISNHLATSHLALRMAEFHLGTRYQAQFDLDHQNEEGFFPEYSGADPGYQSLLNHYLCAFLRAVEKSGMPVQAGLSTALGKSVDFIQWAAFPDGSFAGEIGSRGTSVVYPSGTYLHGGGKFIRTDLSDWFFSSHVPRVDSVNPITADSGNFVPVFNAWALAYLLRQGCPEQASAVMKSEPYRHFPKAGLHFFRSEKTRLAISEKGGGIRGFRLAGDVWKDVSRVAFTRGMLSSQLGSAQMVERTPEKAVFSAQLCPKKDRFNGPLSAIALRIAALALYPFPTLQRALKKALSSYVMSEGSDGGESVRFEISLADLEVRIIGGGKGVQSKSFGFDKHMASANTLTERAL